MSDRRTHEHNEFIYKIWVQAKIENKISLGEVFPSICDVARVMTIYRKISQICVQVK